MKTVGVLLLVLMVMGVSLVQAGNLRKRFLITDAYDTAKESFEKVAPDVDFDAAVQALIPYIHSDMTVLACTAVCVGAAGSVLGPAAFLASVACPPLCDGALAELERRAG